METQGRIFLSCSNTYKDELKVRSVVDVQRLVLQEEVVGELRHQRLALSVRRSSLKDATHDLGQRATLLALKWKDVRHVRRKISFIEIKSGKIWSWPYLLAGDSLSPPEHSLQVWVPQGETKGAQLLKGLERLLQNKTRSEGRGFESQQGMKSPLKATVSKICCFQYNLLFERCDCTLNK